MGRNVFDLKPICVAILSLPLENVSFAVLLLRPCLARRLWPPGSPPAPPSRLSLSHTHSLCYQLVFFPFPPPHTSSPQSRACLAYVLHTAIFHPTTLPQQPKPGHAGSPAGGPDGVLASGPALGSLSLQDGSAALLWPIWPQPVLAPVCDYGPAGRRQSWRRKGCQCAAE